MAGHHAVKPVLILGLAVFLGGCAQVNTVLLFGRLEPPPEGRFVTSRDGSYQGEVMGTPKPGSRFSRVKIGMTVREVLDLLGEPDNIHRYETGKRWLPFYYGADVQRVQFRYKGEGCLTFTGGNTWAGGRQQLIRMVVDAEGQCLIIAEQAGN